MHSECTEEMHQESQLFTSAKASVPLLWLLWGKTQEVNCVNLHINSLEVWAPIQKKPSNSKHRLQSFAFSLIAILHNKDYVFFWPKKNSVKVSSWWPASMTALAAIGHFLSWVKKRQIRQHINIDKMKHMELVEGSYSTHHFKKRIMKGWKVPNNSKS